MQKEVQTMEKDLDERHLEFIDKETECRRMTNKIKALQKSKKTSQPLLQMSQSQTFNSGSNRFLAETSKADLNELSTKLNHQKKELAKAKNSFAAKNDRVKTEIKKIKENNSKQDQQIHLTNTPKYNFEIYFKYSKEQNSLVKSYIFEIFSKQPGTTKFATTHSNSLYENQRA